MEHRRPRQGGRVREVRTRRDLDSARRVGPAGQPGDITCNVGPDPYNGSDQHGWGFRQEHPQVTGIAAAHVGYELLSALADGKG